MTRTIKKCMIFIIFSFSANLMAQEDSSYQAETIANGDIQHAEQQLIEVLKDNPEDPYALLNLAYVYQRAGQEDRARDIYNRILELKANPYAELASGKTQSVKNIARRGIAGIATE